MKALRISNAEEMIAAIQEEIHKTDDARYLRRLHAILLVAQGMNCPQAGKLLGDAPRTVVYWVRRFEKNGFSGLRDGEHPGRPMRLNEEQLSEIACALRKAPTDFGLQGIWDGKTLSEFIHSRWKITIGVRQCQRLFRRLGFRLRKPRPKIAHSDPEAQAAYKKTTRTQER